MTSEDRLASALGGALDELALVLEQAERLAELVYVMIDPARTPSTKMVAEARLTAARLSTWEDRPAIVERRRIMMRALAEYRTDRATG